MQIARKYGVNFFNYSNDPLFLVNPSYFADNMHLNNKGAIAFSNILIDEINKDYLPHREK
jgi:lysophospholipase L1-like esterase